MSSQSEPCTTGADSLLIDVGCYFAILPRLPSIKPEELLRACKSLESLPIPEVIQSLEWTHYRTCHLNHPQLTEPLPFVEISCRIRLLKRGDSNIVDACDHVAKRLMGEDDDNASSSDNPIGNAEVVHILEGTPIPLLPIALPVLDGGNETSAAEYFNEFGLVGLSNVVTEDEIFALKGEALKRFEVLSDAMGKHMKNNNNKKIAHFREIMQRDVNRFDFRLDDVGSTGPNNVAIDTFTREGNEERKELEAIYSWQKLGRYGGWMKAIGKILGNEFSLIRCGCVLSLHGTETQFWHSDGVHVGKSASFDDDNADPAHAVCVFVPLLDLDEETGYTEFWAGSHKYDKLLSKKGEQSLPGGTRGVMSMGDCLIYDYRTIHRGMPNKSKAIRPICYFLYAKKGFESVEDQNFVGNSVFDLGN
mmetsp:Transcript_4932/g.7122  ORF Transcript_4932/g.7122 Transcript_4932/m.7122 type:complete len:419 (-) Transcript_4932:135-1391(-)